VPISFPAPATGFDKRPAGEEIGEHNERVYRDLLGYSEEGWPSSAPRGDLMRSRLSSGSERAYDGPFQGRRDDLGFRPKVVRTSRDSPRGS
jgi:hypothetical protein